LFFAYIFQENTFLETKSNFSLTEKYFPLTNFSNGKQTQSKDVKNAGGIEYLIGLKEFKNKCGYVINQINI
jgi:hypothetical protein